MTPSKDKSRIVAGNANIKARLRTADFRSRYARLDTPIDRDIDSTLRSISSDLDCSKNELVNSLIRFGLTNRNWRQLGLYGGKSIVNRICAGIDKGSGNPSAA